MVPGVQRLGGITTYRATESLTSGGGDGARVAAGPESAQIEIHVVEDHPLYRAALVQALTGGGDMRIGVTAKSVEEFAAFRRACEPERLALRRAGQPERLALRRSAQADRAQAAPSRTVVILDLRLPGVSDAEAVATVVGMGFAVLVLSSYGARSDVLAAMSAGARGYLTKDADIDEIHRAVRQVAAGNSYVSPTLAAYLLDSSRMRYATVQLPLSDRERQVLALLADGRRDQDIADKLSISVRTVRSHLDRIREKTGRRRRPELTRLAIEKGIVNQEDRRP
jgi:DNA-binding NarL/FixJ family response regulator